MAELEAARTAVWWDIDWCAVPPDCSDPHRIARNVIAALAAAGCNGPVSIFAYGDASRIAPGVLEALSATGISLNHVSAGVKDGVDKKMLVDMVFWAYDNPPPGNYLLISGDQDFSDLLHRLKMKKYEILLAQPSNASSQALFTAAKTVWLWESLAAGEPLLAESPHSRSNRNSNNSGASKCSQSKVCAVYNKSDRNSKVGMKRLQKYVKRTDIAASFAINQGQVEPVDGISEDSTGSIMSELERFSVSSSSSSESMEGAKVDQSSLLGTANQSQSSAQKPEGSAHLQQVEISQGFILGEEPSISTKCAPINGVSSERKAKPLQKYVKKRNITSSSGNQVDSVRVYDCSIKSTRSELHLSPFLSSSSESMEGAKVDQSSLLGTANLSQSSAQKPEGSAHLQQVEISQGFILGEEPSISTKCVPINGVTSERKVKSLQKYVKKTSISSSSGNQVDSVRVYDCSIKSTRSELHLSTVLSSSSESMEGAKVDQSSLLGTANLSQSSPQKPEGSAHLQQVEMSQGFILGEEPSISTKCAPINGVSSERKAKSLQKYVKKTNITSSLGNQVDSVRVYDYSIKSTRSELHLSTVLSSSSKSLEGAKVDHASPPGTSTLFQSSAQKPVVSIHLHQVRVPQKSILGKKLSTGHISRDGNHDFGIDIGCYHPTYQQQCQTSQEQNKFHSQCNVGANNGKSGNQYKVKQHQEYAKKTNISSSSASNEIYLGFPGNSKENILGHPSKSMSSSSCSESLAGTKANPPFSLSPAKKPVTPTHLHQVEAELIFGKKPSTSVDCMPKNKTFCFGASNGHYDPTFQQTQSSLLLKQENSGPPHQHSTFGQSYSMNSDTGSSLPPSARHNGVPSSEQQTWASGSTFQGLADICSDMGRLTISECPQGTVETRPPSQGPPVNYPFSGVPYVSGYPGPNTSFYPNHSSAPQSVQPPSSDYTCIPPHPPNLSCNMKNPGSHGETQGSPRSSSEPEGTILKALDILKTEKIYPSESNVADCIRYGEMNLSDFDVKKVLQLAIRHQAVIMKKLVNDMPLFVVKGGSLWKCVNATNSNAKRPKALDTLRKFILSTSGHSAMKNSQSRYQAATILKKMCLQHHALGDVLQILHIAIVIKKWIVPHSSGWQPLSFNTIVVDATSDAIGEARS